MVLSWLWSVAVVVRWKAWVCGSAWWRSDFAFCRSTIEYALGRSAAMGFCVLEVVVCVYRWWGLGLLGFFFFFLLVVVGGCVWWWMGVKGGGDYAVTRFFFFFFFW